MLGFILGIIVVACCRKYAFRGGNFDSFIVDIIIVAILTIIFNAMLLSS